MDVRTPFAWWLLLVAVSVIAPYLLGLRPKSRRDWIALTVTIAFLTWLLAGFASVRAG